MAWPASAPWMAMVRRPYSRRDMPVCRAAIIDELEPKLFPLCGHNDTVMA